MSIVGFVKETIKTEGYDEEYLKYHFEAEKLFLNKDVKSVVLEVDVWVGGVD